MKNYRLGLEIETLYSFNEHDGGAESVMDIGDEIDDCLDKENYFEEIDGEIECARSEYINRSKYIDSAVTDGSLSFGDTEFRSTVFRHSDIHAVVEEISELAEQFGVDESCGIHIHTDKADYTPLSFYKIYSFINDDKNEEFIFELAGRCDGAHHNGTCTNEISAIDILRASEDKYQRVSWRSGIPTVEYRIFNSSLDPSVITVYLEFVSALIEYTNCWASLRDTDIDKDLFVKWVISRGVEYSERPLLVEKFKTMECQCA